MDTQAGLLEPSIPMFVGSSPVRPTTAPYYITSVHPFYGPQAELLQTARTASNTE